MALPCVAQLSAWRVHKRLGWARIRFRGGCAVWWQAWRIMQIVVYGSGYLGTVVSSCLADFGTPVTCCHPDSSRMVEMAQGNVPFFEKNLAEVIKRNVRAGRLAYSTDMESFARKAHVIFLAEDSAQHLGDLAVRIARLAPRPPILSLVTPVPVGTASGVEKRLKQEKLRGTVVSQPVFFTPGCAVEDFNWPDRIIMGTSSNDAVLAQQKGVSLKVLSAAREVNHSLADRLVDKISHVVNSVQNKDLGILGLAFKPNTNSVAGSSSVRLAQSLIAKGARVRAYDPVAIPEAKMQLNGTIRYCETAYAAAEGVDALVVGTGWPEFRALDFDKIKHLLKRPVIVDTKNLLDSVRLRAMGFQYVGVGRG